LARDGDDTVLAERELAALIQGNEQLRVSRARLLEGFQERCKPDTTLLSSLPPPRRYQA
jgi:hypothetical protein